jgi:hypothetical protein
MLGFAVVANIDSVQHVSKHVLVHFDGCTVLAMGCDGSYSVAVENTEVGP